MTLMASKRVLGLVLGVFCGGLVGLVGAVRPAAANVPFSMSGLYRNHCCTKMALPGPVVVTGSYTAFNANTPTAGGAVIDSRPDPGLPQGHYPGRYFGWLHPPASITRPSGKVYQTGLPMTPNNPATLTLPTKAFHATNNYIDANHGSTWTYIRTTFDLYNAPATFMAGRTFPSSLATINGNNYQFCRAAGTAALTYCTAPPGVGGVGDTGFPWMVRVHPGPNHFGGTLQLLGGAAGGFGFGGVAKFKPPSLGGLNRNVYFSFIGGTGAAATVPQIYPLANTIKITLGGVPQPVIHLPGSTYVATVPNVSYQTAMPFTTGTVSVVATVVTSPFLYQQALLVGSDNRTSNGLGNISLVTPTVYTNTGSHQGFPRPSRFNLTLPEPSVALALGAGMTALLGLGRLRRRRERRA